MAYCGNCGTKVDEGKKFCPSCGAPMEAPEAQQQTATEAEPKDFSEKIAALKNTADSTADFDKGDIDQNRAMGILAYISWLVLIPIFAAPKSKYARFHANQGLILAIAETACWIATAILSAIFYAISWRLGAVMTTLLSLVNLLFIPLIVFGIINAAKGKAKELPLLGKFRILK